MYADALVAGILSASLQPAPKHLPLAPKLDRMHFKVLMRSNLEYYLILQ
jgi:hypothetical protein